MPHLEFELERERGLIAEFWNPKLLFLHSFQDSQLLIVSESIRDCLGRKECNPKNAAAERRCIRLPFEQSWAPCGSRLVLSSFVSIMDRQ